MAEERKSPSIENLITQEGSLKPKADIIRTLKSCARKGVTIDPNSYEQVDALDRIDFYAQELKSLRDSMNNGIVVCKRKRPRGAETIYENLAIYFSNRIISNKTAF